MILRKTNQRFRLKIKYVDLKLKKKLTCDAAISPRLYGLPKIHKPNTPLRPVSSSEITISKTMTNTTN